MRVDIQKMDEVYIRLMSLQHQFGDIVHNIRNTIQVLDRTTVGSFVENKLIMESLSLQMKELEQRKETIKQLTGMLHMVQDQYLQCERAVGAQEKDDTVNGVLIPGRLERFDFVPLMKEKEVIHQYIMPFIVTGKKETL